jgi:hypothetical protein
MRMQAAHFDDFCGIALYESPARTRTTIEQPPITRAERAARQDAGLGLTTQEGQSLTMAAASVPIAAAAGPLAPAVMLAAAYAPTWSSPLKWFGPSPYNVPDTLVTQAAEVAVDQIYGAMSGENIPNTGYGQVKNAPQPITHTGYPNTPYGAAGNPNFDPDQAIADVQAIASQATAQLKLAASKKNTFYTNWVPHLVGIFRKMKAARAASGSATSAAGSPATVRSSAPVGSVFAGVNLKTVAIVVGIGTLAALALD